MAASVFVRSRRRAGAPLLSVINVRTSTLSCVNPECMFSISIVCADGCGSFCSWIWVRYRLNATDLTRPADPGGPSGSAAAAAAAVDVLNLAAPSCQA